MTSRLQATHLGRIDLGLFFDEIARGAHTSVLTVNFALALANIRTEQAGPKPRVGLLDLDIFGPSIPKLMGLEGAGEPLLTEGASASRFLGTFRSSHPDAWPCRPQRTA